MITTIKKKIMFGVYLLYCLRKLKNPFVAECLVFVLLAITLVYFVSILSFFSNMFSSGHFYDYLVMAFSNTEFLVQTILVLIAITVFLVVRNITVHAILKTRSA